MRDMVRVRVRERVMDRDGVLEFGELKRNRICRRQGGRMGAWLCMPSIAAGIRQFEIWRVEKEPCRVQTVARSIWGVDWKWL